MLILTPPPPFPALSHTTNGATYSYHIARTIYQDL